MQALAGAIRLLHWHDHGVLLLPAACVLEVVPARVPRALPGAPPWLSGVIDWRGHQLPVVVPLLGAFPASGPARLLVCIGPRGDCGVGLFAVRAASHPVLVSIAPDALAQPLVAPRMRAPLAWLRPLLLRGEPAAALVLAVIEQALGAHAGLLAGDVLSTADQPLA